MGMISGDGAPSSTRLMKCRDSVTRSGSCQRRSVTSLRSNGATPAFLALRGPHAHLRKGSAEKYAQGSWIHIDPHEYRRAVPRHERRDDRVRRWREQPARQQRHREDHQRLRRQRRRPRQRSPCMSLPHLWLRLRRELQRDLGHRSPGQRGWAAGRDSAPWNLESGCSRQ